MLAAAAAGELDVVYVWKLDRLGRSVSERLRAWDALMAAGVRLVSTTEGAQEAGSSIRSPPRSRRRSVG